MQDAVPARESVRRWNHRPYQEGGNCMSDQGNSEEVEKTDQSKNDEDVEGHRMGKPRPQDAAKSNDDGDDVEGHKMGRK